MYLLYLTHMKSFYIISIELLKFLKIILIWYKKSKKKLRVNISQYYLLLNEKNKKFDSFS